MTTDPEERSRRRAPGRGERSRSVRLGPLLWKRMQRLGLPLNIPQPAPLLVQPDTLLRPHTWSATLFTPPPMPRRPRPPAPRQVVLVALGSNEKRPILDFPGERPTM